MPKTVSHNQLELWGSTAPQKEKDEPLLPLFELAAGRSLPSELPADSTPTPANTSSKILESTFAMRRPLNILIADDNAINRKIIRIILQKLGYSCSEAENGAEALHAYKGGTYNYIFMDLDMPEMDGIESAEEIRKWEQNPRQASSQIAEIIAVTANVSDETRRKCRKAGMNGYLEKPITASIIKDQLIRSWPRVRSRSK